MAKSVLVLLLVALIGGSVVSSWAQGSGDDGSLDAVSGKFNGGSPNPPIPPSSYAFSVKHFWDGRPTGNYCGPSLLAYSGKISILFPNNKSGGYSLDLWPNVGSSRPPDDCQDSRMGTWTYYPIGGSSGVIDLSSSQFQTFGLGYYKIDVYYNASSQPFYSSGGGGTGSADDVISNCAIGITMVEVTTTDGKAVTPAASNCTLTLTGNGDSVTVPLSTRTVAGSPYAYAIFGNNADGTTPSLTDNVRTDARYPEGSINAPYTLTVSMPGHQSQIITHTGLEWAGNGAKITFNTANASLDTSAPSPGNDSGDGLNPTSAGTATTGTGTGGTFDPSGFLSSLKQLFLDLFTPAQADVDSLKAVVNNIFSWGPLSIPSQLAAVYQSTFGAVQYEQSSGNPNYWVLSLNACERVIPIDNQHVNTAAGDSNNAAPCGPDASSPWLSFFPGSYDLTSYAYYLQLARKIALGVGWVVFIISLVRYITPRVQV